MRVLVTGSLGVLGRPLVAELTRRGHEVWGCDLQHSDQPNYCRADVAERRQLEWAVGLANPQVIYHLAAEFGRRNGTQFYEQLWRTNQIGTQNLISLCQIRGVPMVLASSSEVYGACDELQQYWPMLDETDTAITPVHHNPYALSKWVQELQVGVAERDVSLPLKAVILRFFNCYGPGEHYTPYRSVVAQFCYKLLHGCPIVVTRNAYRDFLYIDDWTPAVVNVADRLDSVVGQTYNIGGGNYHSIEELAQVVLEQTGADPTLVAYRDEEPGNVAHKRPDISKAQRDLGHAPQMTLADGVAKTLDWMRRVYGLQSGCVPVHGGCTR